jgi:NAD dependent epimerase/dehydratase family enzyme
MSENDQGTNQTHDEARNRGQKEIKQLLWIGIISVWLTMTLILYTGATNYRSSRDVQRLSESQEMSAIMKEVAQLKSEMAQSFGNLSGEQKAVTREIRGQISSSVQKLLAKQEAAIREMSARVAKANESVENRLSEQKATTEAIKTELLASSGKVNETVEKLIRDQKAIHEEIRSALSANATTLNESIEKLIGEQKKEMTEDIKAALSSNWESVQKLLADQKGLIEGIRENALNAEGIGLLKKFLENQKSLLGQLSGALENK